ncbi:hypothetical protein ANN_04465 [Periplaneta americana]|uniref:Uncharacterized protein n=1 Tax=Periplaneta americana TaxID=6978 RepID=A0ABQ8T8M0_PERAM|nr:hypothetical protein ANN_04465 [Periplaneta americana]
MAALCEGGNEPPGSLKASALLRRSSLDPDRRRLSLGTTTTHHRASDVSLDPHHAAILFRDSRGGQGGTKGDVNKGVNERQVEIKTDFSSALRRLTSTTRDLQNDLRHHRSPQNLEELAMALNEEWMNILQVNIWRLVRNMSRRWQTVIRAHGGTRGTKSI